MNLRHLGLVGVGGAIGTGMREALSLLFPPVGGVSLTIAAVNVVGAFVLGFLLESLLRRGDDSGRRRELRLFAGTGILGGFTTYSALAADTAVLLADSRPVLAVAYALGTVVVGFGATLLGLGLAARRGRTS